MNFQPGPRRLLALSLLVTIAACSTTTYESYRPVRNANVDIAYVGASADFSKYRRLKIEEMGIFYPTHAAPSEQDLARVRAAFRKAFLAEIADYDIVDKAAADVMTVTASLVDLRNTAADRLPNISNDINEILKPGRLTFVIEMRDSRSDSVLLRAADTEKSPAIDLPEVGEVNTAEVDAAARHWAELFRAFLDKNLRGIG